MEGKTSQESVFATWVVIFILVLYFLAYSLFTYMVVGVSGQPSWDMGTVKDIPAGSPYAIYKKVPYPQHVRGEKGE